VNGFGTGTALAVPPRAANDAGFSPRDIGFTWATRPLCQARRFLSPMNQGTTGLYQGTTLVVPNRHSKNSGFSPCQQGLKPNPFTTCLRHGLKPCPDTKRIYGIGSLAKTLGFLGSVRHDLRCERM